MNGMEDLDFSKVAPHRHAEVARRINIIESYISGMMTSREAVAELGLTETSFWILVRIWRKTGKPEALLGSGRQRKAQHSATDLQLQLIREAEASALAEPVTQVIARARRLAELRGLELPGLRTMKVLIGELRRSRGLRPDGVVDILVTHCAVDMPVRHGHGVVAPVLSMVLDVRRQVNVLGTALSLMPPSPASSAKALLDALSSADRPRSESLNEFRILTGSGEGWVVLKEALSETALPTILTPARAKSWREVTRLIGDRPGGLKLKPDITARPASERKAQLPRGGSPLDLENAQDIVRGRLRAAFDHPREALLASCREVRATSVRLEQLIAYGSSSPTMTTVDKRT